MQNNHQCRECLGLTVSPADARIMLSEIDSAAEHVAGCYDQLSVHSKAAALDLGHSLSSLQQKLQAIVTRAAIAERVSRVPIFRGRLAEPQHA